VRRNGRDAPRAVGRRQAGNLSGSDPKAVVSSSAARWLILTRTGLFGFLATPSHRFRPGSPEGFARPDRFPRGERCWSLQEKLRILAQSVAPESSASLVCRLHGISSGQLYARRQKFRTGELTGRAPVTIGSAGGTASGGRGTGGSNVDTPVADQPAGGTIEVELPSGVKLRLTGAVDEAALHRVDRQRSSSLSGSRNLSL
jgi:transposase